MRVRNIEAGIVIGVGPSVHASSVTRPGRGRPWSYPLFADRAVMA